MGGEIYLFLFKTKRMECKYIFDYNILELKDNKIYSYYPTRQHEKSNSRWWASRKFLKEYIPYIIEENKKMEDYIIWGKPKEN